VSDQPLQDAELRALAQRLGTEAADRLDPDSTARAVVRRLRDQPGAVDRTPPLRTWLSLAAAVVLLLGAGLVWRNGRRQNESASATALAPAGLDLNSLTADQLREVLSTVDQPLDVDPNGSAETGLDDLTPRELRSLLRSLEGLEG
jgi:hypothetical protein